MVTASTVVTASTASAFFVLFLAVDFLAVF